MSTVSKAIRKSRQTPKQTAFQFFFANAGYAYDSTKETRHQGRSRCARQLAKAERDAVALGYTFDWVEDVDADRSWFEHDSVSPEPQEAFGCIMRNEADNPVQSLWGIFDPTREYRRVVEAELAAAYGCLQGSKRSNPNHF